MTVVVFFFVLFEFQFVLIYNCSLFILDLLFVVFYYILFIRSSHNFYSVSQNFLYILKNYDMIIFVILFVVKYEFRFAIDDLLYLLVNNRHCLQLKYHFIYAQKHTCSFIFPNDIILRGIFVINNLYYFFVIFFLIHYV